MGHLRDPRVVGRWPGRRGHHPGHQQPAAQHRMNTAAAPRLRRGPARWGRSGCDRGSAAIEFAITAVAVMGIIFAAIQAATYFWARSIALAAAGDAVDA